MKTRDCAKIIWSKTTALYILSALLISLSHATMAIEYAPPSDANANGVSTYLDSNGKAVTLNVRAEQRDGPNGAVILTASSQGVTDFFSQNYEKRCVLIIDGPFQEDMPPMLQAESMPQLGSMLQMGMSSHSETLLSYHPEQQALTGAFSVDTPGSYMIRVDFGDGQTDLDSPALVNFRLQAKEPEPIEVRNGDEITRSLAKLLGWDGLNLTVKNVRILETSSGAAEITPTVSGNAVNSLRIKGTRTGNLEAEVSVIYNGQPDVAHITVQIARSSWPLPVPPVAPLGILLAALLVLFLLLIYANFVKRIPGSFVINCECGATRFHIGMKAPHGRSMTLYQLLNGMLKQRTGDHDAEIIRGIMNDSDNKKNLKQIRVYIVKGEDKRPHYAFSKAGNPETVLDDTMKTAYPDFGNRNSKLTVNLSFIAQWSSIKRR